MTTAVVFGLGFVIAYVNGANDVSKGIATLAGSGVTNYRKAIRWGALFTALGGIAGAVLAGAMVQTFGKGLLQPGASATLTAAIATIVGAAAWVLIATRMGLPVSTTHAIVGALIGVASLAYGRHAVAWHALAQKVALPLAASPLVAIAATVLLARATSGLGRTDCVCAEVAPTPSGSGTAAVQLQIVSCESDRPAAARVTMGHLHWLTSGATSFARGMNDAPKMAALVLAALATSGSRHASSPALFAWITAGMVAGSLVAGRRVTHVLAERVTPLDHREGFVANGVTAGLVVAGSVLGWPMSTTHVASSAIIGVGAQRRAGSLNRKTVREMVLAWFLTLPAAGLFGTAAYEVLRLLRP